MTGTSASKRGLQFDTTIIIFGIVCLAAALTWIVPAGSFEREVIEFADGGTREVVVPGTFQYVEDSDPQGVFDVLRAPIRGLVDAAPIVAFVLLVGGAFGVFQQTGAVEAGLSRLIERAEASPAVERAIIPGFMTLFALGGAIFGMAEETLPFVLVFVPLAIRLGYDGITGMAIVMVGSQVGFAAAFLNPFTIGIAQGISGVPLFSGIGFRVGMWVLFVATSIAWVMRYASRVKADPRRSVLYGHPLDLPSADRSEVAGPADEADGLRESRMLPVLGVGLAGLAVLVWGVLARGWYIEEIAALFVALGIVVGAVAGMSATGISSAFTRGVRDLAGTALLIGVARGILTVLEGGGIIDTVLFGLSATIGGLGALASAEAMLLMQSVLNFFVPSGSGQAALTMPLMSQFADLVGVTRQTAVLAFQLGDGITNVINPTNYVLVGALGLVGIPWVRWARWVAGLALLLTGLAAVVIAVAVTIGY